MPRVVMGTVVADSSDLDWLRLQSKYIARHTAWDYKHVCVHYGPSNPEVEALVHQNKSIECNHPKSNGCILHANGLNILGQIFMTEFQDYDLFVLLDSDAFPISSQWCDTMSHVLLDGQFEIATPIRYANSDRTRQHASVIIGNRSALQHYGKFGIDLSASKLNLMNETHYDTSLMHYNNPEREMHKWFPLLRSNAVNIHPLLCAVYYDMFYHHAGASRYPENFAKAASKTQVVPKTRGQDYWQPLESRQDEMFHPKFDDFYFNFFQLHEEAIRFLTTRPGLLDSRGAA